MQSPVLKVHPEDNVLVALRSLSRNEVIAWEGKSITLPGRVAAKHKLVIEPLKAGDPVTMYGVLVGHATRDIPEGGLVSTENLVHASSDARYLGNRPTWNPPDASRWHERTFDGYVREDGQVGTANYWLVLPLVFCENRNVDFLRQAFESELGFQRSGVYQSQVKVLAEAYRSGVDADSILQIDLATESGKRNPVRLFPNIDGIQFLTHEGGCGGTREDAQVLCGLLAGYAHHPNVAGVTVLSLGCQHAQIALFKDELGKRSGTFEKPLLIYEQQRYPSELAMMSEAIKETFAGLVRANEQERTAASLSNLVMGVECGGSDGFSGLSANPAIGYAADLLVALGGSVILSEFPELCGVEQDLVDRSVDESVACRFLDLMKAYSDRAHAVGSGFDMNPSPGNIRDGLITDAIKSAGAAKKGGTSPVVDVLDYPEYIRRRGLNLLCTPGNDVESTTAMAGSGANIICFSTGLGTPTGNPVAPVLKISTSTQLAERLPDLIDLDAGPIIDGKKSIDEIGSEILDEVIEVASGRKQTKAQQLGQFDFIPWKRGVSL